MDEPVLQTPIPTGELKELITQAKVAYASQFDNTTWFGRCIFLSWYCKIGTCKFCFRSTQKHKIQNPSTARRTLASVLSEAVLIKGFNWRIEFLTGGYGIMKFDELKRIVKLCRQILGEDMWINLGTLPLEELKELKTLTKGVVSSLETIEPKLHDFVCPDKPIEPYFEFMDNAKSLGFKQSFTLVIGLGEKKDDYKYVKDLIDKYMFDRVTIYALRPIKETIYTHGPTPEEVAWWIAKIRVDFPHIEIIAGTARYRIPEISLFLDAGANAFTKLPATNIFNTKDAIRVLDEIQKAGRVTDSLFTIKDINSIDWNGILKQADLTEDEYKETRMVLQRYLDKIAKKGKKLFVDTHDEKATTINDKHDTIDSCSL